MNFNIFTARPKESDNKASHKLIAHMVGQLLLFEPLLLLACCGVSLWYGEEDWKAFLISLSACALVSVTLLIYGRNSSDTASRTEGYIVVAFSWVFYTLFGMMPYVVGGYIPSVTDAFFETISGFTTTGATILNNIEQMPHGILFWRSLTQWIGGLGIVCFTIILLPGFGTSGQMLFSSEATGVTHDKIHPKTRIMARYIWTIYCIITALETVLLIAGGMGVFDALCHAFTTTSTGGFSTKQASVAYWNSPFMEYVISLFMLFSSVNFSLYFIAVKGHFRQVWHSVELRWFLASVGVLTIIITLTLIWQNGYGVEEAFRKAFFQMSSLHTSCGFATDDYNLWPPFTWMLILFAMLSGGCTGSTSGGIKSLRLAIIAICIKNQFRQILHPHAVLPVRAGKMFDNKVVTTVLAFFATYFVLIFVGCLLLMLLGVGFTEATGTVVSAMGNTGPGLGKFGPAYTWALLPDAGKWILSVLMIIGRLEIFGFLLIFYPPTWRGSWA